MVEDLPSLTDRAAVSLPGDKVLNADILTLLYGDVDGVHRVFGSRIPDLTSSIDDALLALATEFPGSRWILTPEGCTVHMPGTGTKTEFRAARPDIAGHGAALAILLCILEARDL